MRDVEGVICLQRGERVVVPELCDDQLHFDGLEGTIAGNGGAGGIRGDRRFQDGMGEEWSVLSDSLSLCCCSLSWVRSACSAAGSVLAGGRGNVRVEVYAKCDSRREWELEFGTRMECRCTGKVYGSIRRMGGRVGLEVNLAKCALVVTPSVEPILVMQGELYGG